MHKYELTVLARLLIGQGRPAEAVQVLAPVAPIAERRRRTGLLIECLAIQALAWQAQGDLDRALEVLGRALLAGEPEGYVRVFVDEGQPMKALLSAYRSRKAEPGVRLYVDHLLATYGPYPAQDAVAPGPPLPAELQPTQDGDDAGALGAPLLESLSERELEVLHLLRTPLTQPEIADRLYVSVNTVRSHVKHIYAKLDVHGRTAAVERAEELGLL
jgi:LuxR family maltose regulon positive regulatory protein